MDVLNYERVFPNYPPLLMTKRWVYGLWMIGANYRSHSGYYGSYPPSYLKRIWSLFPAANTVLHAFSGTVEKGYWPTEVTVDINADLGPDYTASVEDLPFPDSMFDLILADPPYSGEDATKYNCKMPNRKKSLQELHRVVKPGGYIVWLDTVFPMFSKAKLSLVGTIGLVRSTNHRVRGVFIFQKVSDTGGVNGG